MRGLAELPFRGWTSWAVPLALLILHPLLQKAAASSAFRL